MDRRACLKLLVLLAAAQLAAELWRRRSGRLLAYAPPAPLAACKARGRTRLYLDTADEGQWAKHLPLGIFDGVTTNPELCRRAGVAVNEQRLEELARAALDQVDEVMIQAWGGTVEAYVETGMAMSRLNPGRVIVKLPLTRAGVEAASRLRERGVRLCMTACYTQHQVFTAVGLGAEFVAPYLGRICDDYQAKTGCSEDEAVEYGLGELKAMQRIVTGMGASTRVLVASIRKPEYLAALAAAGCETFTFSPAVAEALTGVKLTEDAAASFEEAAKVAGAATESAR